MESRDAFDVDDFEFCNSKRPAISQSVTNKERRLGKLDEMEQIAKHLKNHGQKDMLAQIFKKVRFYPIIMIIH